MHKLTDEDEEGKELEEFGTAFHRRCLVSIVVTMS